MNLVRPPRDDRVDRPDVDALQGAELTGTNRPRACPTHHHRQLRAYPLYGSRPPHPPTRGLVRHTCESQHNTSSVWNTPRFWCSGGHGWRETPGPIPNPEVKPPHADGTAHASGWESKTPPEHHTHPRGRGPAPRGAPPSFHMHLHITASWPTDPMRGSADPHHDRMSIVAAHRGEPGAP